MALTTTHKLVRFDATKAILYIRIQIKDGATVIETVDDVPIRLPVDVAGAVPVGTALQQLIDKAISGMFTQKILAEKERLYRIAQAGGVVTNAIEIEALTEVPEGSENSPYFVGYVYDQYGTPQGGATVRSTASGGIYTTTNEFGYYLFEATAGLQTLIVEKSGYITGYKQLDCQVLTHADIIITDRIGIASTHVVANANSQENTVVNTGRTANSVEITFPAGAVLDSPFGSPVSSFNINLANLVVSDPGVLGAFPGVFLGNVGGGIPYPIASYGFMNAKITDDYGTELTLDPTVGATIRMPVDPDPVGVNSIPTWRLDDSSDGVWARTGTAYRVGSTNVFEFDVTSFSWHNFDVALTDTVTMTINCWDDEEPEYGWSDLPTLPTTTAAAGVEVTVSISDTSPYYSTDSRWEGRGTTDISGQLVLEVPKGYLSVKGKKGDKVYWGHAYNIDEMTNNVTLDMYYYIPTPPLPPTPPGILGYLFDITYDTPVTSFVVSDVIGTITPGKMFTLAGNTRTVSMATDEGGANWTITFGAPITISEQDAPLGTEIAFTSQG